MFRLLRRKTVRSSLLLHVAWLLPMSLSARPVQAHIDVDMGGTHMSRVSGGYEIKTSPCGMADAPRTTNVYRYRPGATINIKVVETIPHPGYFRISFDADGTDDFVIPSGTSGEFGDCGGNPSCGPGKEDYCSDDSVLLDNLDPHAGGAEKTYTWSVTLPDVECSNCTLQIIQMMNDFAPFHSPATYPADDIYYHCIDLELSKDAPETSDAPVKNNGMVCKGGNAGAAGAMSAAGASGAAASGAGAGAGGANSSAAGSGSKPAATAGTSASAGAGGTKAAVGGSSAPTTGTAAAAGTTAAAASEPASASNEGGCHAASSNSNGMFSLTLFGIAALTLRGRRRTG